MNFNILINNITSLKILLINMNNSSNEEDNMKKIKMNIVQKVNES